MLLTLPSESTKRGGFHSLVRSKPEDKVVDLDLKHTIEDWVMTKKRSTKFWLKVGLNRCTYPWKRIRSDDYSSNSVTEVSSVKMEVAVKMILHVRYGCSLLRKGFLNGATSTVLVAAIAAGCY